MYPDPNRTPLWEIPKKSILTSQKKVGVFGFENPQESLEPMDLQLMDPPKSHMRGIWS